MEHLKGDTLAALLRRSKTISTRRLCRIAIQICAALSEAHDKGVVHRDLKPDNVFLCKGSGEKDSVRLLDFGVAKITDGEPGKESYTQTGFICGTPRYISPEQALGKSLDGRADLYSLGIMLFEMVTGEPVFRADTPIALVMKHVHDAPPTMKEANPNVQIIPALESLIEQLLEKDSRRRPSTAKEVSDALDDLLNSRASMPAAAVPIVREGKGLKRSVSSPTLHRDVSTSTDDQTSPGMPIAVVTGDMDTDEDGIEPPSFDATQMLSVTAIAEQLAAHVDAGGSEDVSAPVSGSGLIELRAGVGTGRKNWSGMFMALVILLAVGSMVLFLGTDTELSEEPAKDVPPNEMSEVMPPAGTMSSRTVEFATRRPGRALETPSVTESPVVSAAAAPKPADSPIPSFVLIESDPVGALVVIRGRLVGQTPYRFQPTADTAATTLIVTKDGHLPESWHYQPTVNPPSGQRTVKLVLPPIPTLQQPRAGQGGAATKQRKRRRRKPSVIWED